MSDNSFFGLLLFIGFTLSVGSVVGIVLLAKNMNKQNQVAFVLLIVVLGFVGFAGLATAGCGAMMSGTHF